MSEEIKSRLKNYKIENQLEEGASGFVFRGIEIATGRNVAIKKIEIEKKSCADNEIKANIVLGKNKYITEMFDHFEDQHYVYLVFEYTSYGDVVRYLNHGMYRKDLPLVRKIIRDVCKGLLYCHSKNVCHKDIKPENILVFNDEIKDEIYFKLCDLGLSDCFDKPTSIRGGTAYFMAPELSNLKSSYYCNESDMWSVGITTYYIYFGKIPYREEQIDDDDTNMDIYIENNDENVEMVLDFSDANYVDKIFYNFISKLLKEDNPKERMTAKQALEHPFLSLKENVKIPAYKEKTLFS